MCINTHAVADVRDQMQYLQWAGPLMSVLHCTQSLGSGNLTHRVHVHLTSCYAESAASLGPHQRACHTGADCFAPFCALAQISMHAEQCRSAAGVPGVRIHASAASDDICRVHGATASPPKALKTWHVQLAPSGSRAAVRAQLAPESSYRHVHYNSNATGRHCVRAAPRLSACSASSVRAAVTAAATGTAAQAAPSPIRFATYPVRDRDKSRCEIEAAGCHVLSTGRGPVLEAAVSASPESLRRRRRNTTSATLLLLLPLVRGAGTATIQ